MTHDKTGPGFPRSVEAIAERACDKDDVLGFGFDVLSDYLPDRLAAPLFREYTPRDGKDAGDFAGYGPPQGKTYPLDAGDADHIVASVRHYMAFAWGKVRNHRGLSAGRSVEKVGAWLWLLGHDPCDIYDTDEDWGQYGAGCLARACVLLGLPVPDGEDLARMIRGEPCVPGCDEGCGQ